jgi:hypothetical protein
MTVDEELTLLEDQLRKLKVEYDAYFGGGMKRPPNDTEWRVKNLISKYGDMKVTGAQRFRYKALASRYAIFSDLWRTKLKIKEEGYRRPQDALLGIQGLRTEQEHAAARELRASPAAGPLKLACHDPAEQKNDIRRLYDDLLAARARNGEPPPESGFDSFFGFIERKTAQVRTEDHCAAVEFWVESEDGRVKLRFRPKSSN